jgi:2-polyprenyl-3-methyl-5-hydroxy-6-metoxy-1,4-benzoquinol methylase
MEYYEQSRPEMLEFLPPELTRLIDIGCGEGRFGEAVKARFPRCETWGVEAVAHAAQQAALRNDVVKNSSIESADDLPSQYFDVVSMNDVLEHLLWPEPALALAKRLLRPAGTLNISLPNVAYYLNVRDLLIHNDWSYRDFGVLDRTHFRFYTTKSAIDLLSSNGFEVRCVKGINAPRLKLHYKALFALAPAKFQWMRYPQFAIVASLAK